MQKAGREVEVALSAFDDKAHISSEYGPVTEQWNFSGKNYGWGFRLKHKERIVLYMTPCKGHFLASFALGEKAVRAARESGLPDPVLKIIDAAPKYAEGRGVRVEVKSKKDLENVKALAAIKMGN